jgi:phage repressor protein C with HTH and peptisase S24 domain
MLEMRPIDRFIKYIVSKGVSPSNAEQTLGLGNGYIRKQKNGKGGIGSEVLEKIVANYPELSLTWLVTGADEMLKKSSPKSSPTPSPTDKKYKKGEFPLSIASEPEAVGLLHPTVAIPITDIQVAAGEGIFNSDFVQNVDVVRLPSNLLKKNGNYLCVRIKGQSMSPTLQDGGYIVIRLLDRSEWAKMPDERVYVVSDMEGKSFLKRVKNRFKQGFAVLMSDNPDKASFPNFNIQADEINTIWYAEFYLSAKMPNIHDQYYSRLQRLEDEVEVIRKGLKGIAK